MGDRYHSLFPFFYCRFCQRNPREGVYFCLCHGAAHLCPECYADRDALGDEEHDLCDIDFVEPVVHEQYVDAWLHTPPPAGDETAAQGGLVPDRDVFLLRLGIFGHTPGAVCTIGHAFLLNGRVYTALHTMNELRDKQETPRDIQVYNLMHQGSPKLWMQRQVNNLVLPVETQEQSVEQDWVSWRADGPVTNSVKQCESRPKPGSLAFIFSANGLTVCTLLSAPGTHLVLVSTDPQDEYVFISGSPVLDEHGQVFGLVTTKSRVKSETSANRVLFGGTFLPEL